MNLLKSIIFKIITKYQINSINLSSNDYKFKGILINDYTKQILQIHEKLISRDLLIQDRKTNLESILNIYNSYKTNYSNLNSKYYSLLWTIKKSENKLELDKENTAKNDKLKNDINLLNIKILNLENEQNEIKIRMKKEYDIIIEDKNKIKEKIERKRKRMINIIKKRATIDEIIIDINVFKNKNKTNNDNNNLIKLKTVNLSDIYNNIIILKYKILLKKLNFENLKTILIPKNNRRSGFISILELNEIFTLKLFRLNNIIEINLISRFLIEDNNEEYNHFDYNMENSIDIVFSIFKNLIGNIFLPEEFELEKYYNKLVVIVNKHWNSLVSSKNFLEKKNYLPIYEIFDIFKQCGISFKQIEKKNFLFDYLHLIKNCYLYNLMIF